MAPGAEKRKRRTTSGYIGPTRKKLFVKASANDTVIEFYFLTTPGTKVFFAVWMGRKSFFIEKSEIPRLLRIFWFEKNMAEKSSFDYIFKDVK